ncbi:glycosyltransferase family 4 protein [Candidatus Nitrospira nitrificans]|uniref:Putative Glycosyltransferase n=1 Tax=Candidatus Nitrospira nitrificans TaxID=1742973 RepID=A0A0S4LEA2_9BACT|nr:glycosyltransferase family 4 protein [Candidatus Nitrospira nitrificans]CUS34219.1 putative Glycosyltransferase [Candidatus Nitrospira nitrificans]
MAIHSSVDQNNTRLQIPMHCRLLYVVGQLGLGGLERQLYYLLANLDHARYCPGVVVLSLNPDDKYYRDIKKLKVPIYGFPANEPSLSRLKALRVIARQIAPEVIHSYGFHTNFAAYYAAWGTGSLAIGSLRAEYKAHKRSNGLIRGVLNARYPAYHISNNTPSADAANHASSFFAPKHVFVVRNAIDLNLFNCASEASRKRYYVAAVGSLLPVKRWDRLLRIVKRLSSVAGENICFQIAGDGPLRRALEKLADELGISNIVEFRGAVHDIPDFLSRAKFQVHTSEREGCPNAVMEAASCGLPVVAMKTGEIPYLVEEGKTGFVVPQGDETMFVERVALLLGDDELCTRMGLAARAKAEREFRLERLVSETLAAYKCAGWKG